MVIVGFWEILYGEVCSGCMEVVVWLLVKEVDLNVMKVY